MANQLARAVARLERSDAIQLQMRMHMFFAKIYTPLTKSYERLQESFERLSSGLDRNVLGLGHKTATTYDGLRKRSWCRRSRSKLDAEAREQSEDSRGQANRCGSSVIESSNNDDQAWDWRGIPEQHSVGRLYNYISTGWMIFASLKTMFLDQLSMLVNPVSRRWLGAPGHCLILGRFVTHPTNNYLSVISLSCCHLIWRFVQGYARQGNKLTLVLFLLQSDKDLEHFYELIKTNRTGERLQPGLSRPTTGTKLAEADGVHSQKPADPKSNCVGATLCLNSPRMWLRHQNEIQADSGEAKRHRGDMVGLRQRVTAQEHLMRHLTCYEVRCGDRLSYRLRPNRTRRARKKLIGQVARSSLFVLAIFATLALFFTTYVSFLILSDVRYALNYPGCYPLLDQLYAAGRLRIYDCTLKGHHLAASILDSVENFIIWLDSIMSVVFVPVLAYLINYDILLYWSYLQEKLELLLEKTRMSNGLSMCCIQNCRSEGSDWTGEEMVEERVEDLHANRWQRHLQAKTASSSDREAFWILQRELDEDINELQFEMIDFFRQVRRADRLIGDILSTAICAWLSTCACIGYYCLVRNKSNVPEVVQLLLFLGFMAVALTSYFLLGLRRSCLRSYQTLASLMASDGTLKRLQLIKLLDFFTQLDRTTYKLFQLYPYRPTTFFTIVGWSFSCFFIALTLFGGRALMVL